MITRCIGALSGTSMDGISLGLFEFTDNKLSKTIAHMDHPVPQDYRSNLLTIIARGKLSFDEFGQLDNLIGEIFANAINNFTQQFAIDITTIDAIGLHGQTIWHAPNIARPFTLQIGDPNIVAYKTKITTIADFRRADIAAGGQGAPLAPVFHQSLFATNNASHCIVNVGGFSNLTILEDNTYIGFDTGPGNCLMDYWVAEHFQKDYDEDGKLAATAKPNLSLLENMLMDPYFAQKPPKSTGREYFNAAWLAKHLDTFDCSKITVLSTLLHLTAISISNSIKDNAKPTTKVFLCGGGAYNKELCKQLSILLEQDVTSTEILGLEPNSVEAALFAWLANKRLQRQTIDLRQVTGSTQPVLLGGIFAAS